MSKTNPITVKRTREESMIYAAAFARRFEDERLACIAMRPPVDTDDWNNIADGAANYATHVVAAHRSATKRPRRRER